MFGYVLPDKPELKLREYDMFKGYYCGVCKAIGKRWGQLARATLNYDATFLALLLDSVSEDNLSAKRERCMVHPLKKKAVIKENRWIDYASDINIALAYLNMEDDWKDEKSYISFAGMGLLKKSYKKIKKLYPNKCNVIETSLMELARLERQKCDIIDEVAQPFASIMQNIMLAPFLPDDPALKRTLGWIGYNMGRWIYILDAFDDLEKDVSNKSYNPLLSQYKYQGEPMEEFKSRIKSFVEFSLVFSLSEMEKAYRLLDIRKNKGILDNIFLLGLMKKTEYVLKGRGKNEESI